MGRSREAVRQDQRDRLLDCALQAIATSGYDGVRLRDIGDAAGVTTGMIQYYFNSRDELLTAAMQRLGLMQIEAWMKLCETDDDPRRRLRGFIGPSQFRLSAAQQSAAWLQFCAVSSRNDELREVLKSVYRRWRELIEDTIRLGIERKVFHPVLPAAELAEALILLLDGSELGVGSGAGNLDSASTDVLTVSVIERLVGITDES